MLDPRESVEVLAEKVVGMSEWTGLEQEAGLRPLLLGGDGIPRDPLKYAEIFASAALLANDNRMKLACRVEAVNGWRRDPDWPLDKLLEETNSIINDLLVLPNNHQVKGKVYFNLSLILRGLRNYQDASHYQGIAAAHYFLAGDKVLAFCSIFLGAVEIASYRLSTNPTSRESRAACLAVLAADELIRGMLFTYPSWMKENAAMHIVWAQMMRNCAVSGLWHSDLFAGVPQSVQDAALLTNSPHWKALLETALLHRMEQYQDAAHNATAAQSKYGELKSSSVKNVMLSCQIVKALALANLSGDKQVSLTDLHDVVQYNGPDGGVPVAVAKHLLECNKQ